MTAPPKRRPPPSLARIEARDRRGAAIHEAGHFVAAIATGDDPEAWIYRTDGDLDPISGSIWGGVTGVFGLFSAPRKVALAGIIAEEISAGTIEDTLDEPEEILFSIQWMSPTDRHLAGLDHWTQFEHVEDVDDQELEEVITEAGAVALILQDWWELVLYEARQLILKARTQVPPWYAHVMAVPPAVKSQTAPRPPAIADRRSAS